MCENRPELHTNGPDTEHLKEIQTSCLKQVGCVDEFLSIFMQNYKKAPNNNIILK